jgi:hypothetical protein
LAATPLPFGVRHASVFPNSLKQRRRLGHHFLIMLFHFTTAQSPRKKEFFFLSFTLFKENLLLSVFVQRPCKTRATRIPRNESRNRHARQVSLKGGICWVSLVSIWPRLKYDVRHSLILREKPLIELITQRRLKLLRMIDHINEAF